MKTTRDYFVRRREHKPADPFEWAVIESTRDGKTRELLMVRLVCVCTTRPKAIGVAKALTNGGFVVNRS